MSFCSILYSYLKAWFLKLNVFMLHALSQSVRVSSQVSIMYYVTCSFAIHNYKRTGRKAIKLSGITISSYVHTSNFKHWSEKKTKWLVEQYCDTRYITIVKLPLRGPVTQNHMSLHIIVETPLQLKAGATRND